MITFGLAQLEHLDQIVGLLADDNFGETREDDDVRVYLDAFREISDDPNQFLVVGLEDVAVVATLQLTVIPGLSRRGTKRGQIEAVRVASSRRGEGIGTLLIKWVVDLATEHGCELIQLTTDRRRDDAVAFYRGLGFEDSHVGLKLRLDGQ